MPNGDLNMLLKKQQERQEWHHHRPRGVLDLFFYAGHHKPHLQQSSRELCIEIFFATIR
ncbi:uncharacterized protein PHALS_04333 [Plasmopara halstedii]|uniref:Uncharacterized protein n=1 Tax=Plasmopara halstedii TaxID=4781 RepID=A0A0P1B173_PLAHL|nr:uncharacterized protein PHALS_04333 [Plasmopara halstedii]CEG47460.1 hypothetical protein PHALS_04333 [Plasmopara halstedii]|eukprot:XP_024583829.1 hypothetical protein PHALS_04333 [Plasmopara halstedii]